MVLGMACLSAYADQAEVAIAAYADNPNQPGSEIAELRSEKTQASMGKIDSGKEAVSAPNPTHQGSNMNPGVDEIVIVPVLSSEECNVMIEANDQMQYGVEKFNVDQDACAEFTITLKHIGSLPVAAMGHNVVLSRAGDMNGIIADGISAGLENEYVKPNDERVLAMTLMIGGGEESAITFNTEKLDPGGEYAFFCTFPGHASIMKGTVTVTAM